VVVALALCAAASTVAHAVRPRPGPPDAAPWATVGAALRAPVESALGRKAAARLLARPAVRRALREAFAGFQAGRDRVTVALEGPGDGAGQGARLVVRVYVGPDARCLRLDPGSSERGPGACQATASRPPRTVRLDDDLWRRRPGRKRRRRPRADPEPPAKPHPSRTSPGELDGDARPPSVLRLPGRPRDPVREPTEGQRLLGALGALRQMARAARWKDPFAPRWEVGDDAPDVKLLRRGRPPAWPQWTSIEGNALENLRYYFGQGRMRPAWPVPDFFGDRVRRPPREAGAGAVGKPDGDCLVAWAAREQHPDPPKLACFRQAFRYRRLSRDTVYQAASLLSGFLAFPVFGQIMAARVGETRRETVSSALWLHTWMGWARLHPKRLGAAARGLSRSERGRLREHLWRWWGRRAYAAYDGTISRLYERHFGALYPAALGADGLPERGRFPTPGLWAINWLHAVERLTPPRRREVICALDARPEDALLVRRLAAEPGVARQLPRVAAALAAAAKPTLPAPGGSP